jgi:Fur family transcriptional regulator, zinc uptake regulator
MFDPSARRTPIRMPFHPRDHDHQHCLHEALSRADLQCRQNGQRLTAIRRRVLALIWQNHEPVKAYDLLAQLREENPRAAPPTVYRALDFLLQEGFVHRIATLNAFVGCGEPGERHGGQFLICTSCGAAAEMDDDDLKQILAERAGRMGFRVEGTTLEINGRCAECLGRTDGSP